LAHVGHDAFGRLPRARRETGQRERRPHQLEKIAPPHAGVFVFAPANGLPRKFAFQQIVELGSRRQIFQAAPVFAPAPGLERRANLRQI